MRAREVGKGQSHSHPYHVDIQVGSCIFLNAFMFNHCMCTKVGSNPCRRLSLLGIAHPVEGSLFQVQRVFGMMTLIRGRFENKVDMWLWYLFCKT